jgi:S1-C subfamily serine protease
MKKILLLAFLLAGCTSQSSLFIAPDGRVARCAHWGWGGYGTTVAMMNQSNCERDARMTGMIQLPEAYAGVALDFKSNKSMVITEVMEPSKSVGVQKGDVMRSVDGVAMSVPWDYMKAIAKKSVGDIVNIQVERDSKPMTFAVKTISREKMND